jgi:signal transduction histidine kinase
MLFTTPEMRSSLNHPVGAGVVVILLIAAAILFVGDSQVERSVVQDARAVQTRELARFDEILHYSGVDIGDRGSLEALTASPEFDVAVRRALFGANAQRLDLYSLQGEPLYSTTRNLPAAPVSGSLVAFDEARRGVVASVFRSGAATLESFGLVRDLPPNEAGTGRSLMVAALSTDVSSEIESAYQTIWLIAGVFTVGSLIIVATVQWVSVRSRARLEHANRQLAARNVAVKESRERMIAAADATKRAIAEELHGTVQTKLYALWMRLSQVKTNADQGASPDPSELTEMADELDSIREDDIRGLSHRLHPSIVRVGALPALRSLVSNYGANLTTALVVNKAASGVEAGGTSELPEDLRLGAYRIAELAIGNVIKHAAAQKCTVSWLYEPDAGRIVLKIEDDGVGFDTSMAPTSGLGVVNIKDYADSLGGVVTLASTAGSGTSLTVTFPFWREQDQPDRRYSRPRGNRFESPSAA